MTVFEWVYLIGIIPSFVLLFRQTYIADAREAANWQYNEPADKEIVSYAVIKSAVLSFFWPLFVIFVLVIYSTMFLGNTLKRLLRL